MSSQKSAYEYLKQLYLSLTTWGSNQDILISEWLNYGTLIQWNVIQQ